MKRDKSGRALLSLVRQRLVSFEDFESWDPPVSPSLNEGDFLAPYWTPELCVPARDKAFVQRLLHDFAYQFRHILRRRYNDLTFRRLARAVVRIGMMDFSIVQLTERRHGVRGPYVWVDQLPEWDPFDSALVRVGHSWCALSQDPSEGLRLVREHMETQRESEMLAKDREIKYLILSMRHIILCRVDAEKLEWTSPEPFFDGERPPSDRAIDLLLSTTSVEHPRTSLYRFPLEIQDSILRYTSQGPVEPARLGCVLGLGSPFLWLDGKMPLEREEANRTRVECSPVESKIFFDTYMSGLSYKAERSQVWHPRLSIK